MACNMRGVACAAFFLSLTWTASARVKATIDHNTGESATPAFKFERVPSPVKNNAASGAKVKLIVGEASSDSGGTAALTDGKLPQEQDQPNANFFFATDTDGGRFLVDLGRAMDIAQVNTYSWHTGSRAPQVYNLFVSDGSARNFNPEPDANTDPANCGWTLMITVDSRSKYGNGGGQYGVSITDSSGSLGKVRYLLFDSIPTEDDDAWGNTFFSEVNVIAKK